jgi:hypothetical protein
MQTYEKPGTMRSAIVTSTPRPGQTIELPAGLSYTNEFFGTRTTLTKPVAVRVIARERDEFYWKNPQGRTCYARFSLSS